MVDPGQQADQGHRADEEWLFHLPEFLDRVREQGAHGINDELDLDLGGVLYHHRGARLPGYNATFLWNGDTFELELDAVGPRSAWAVFDADRSWDFFIRRVAGDQPCLIWMTDAEFAEDEADQFESKEAAVGLDRFSFGLYLHAPRTWPDLEQRAKETAAPVFVHRPNGQTFVPEETEIGAFAQALPEELRPDDTTPPEYLGVLEAHIHSE